MAEMENMTASAAKAAAKRKVARLAFWSMSRDNGGCPGQTFASPTCSGVAQSTWQFSSSFSGF